MSEETSSVETKTTYEPGDIVRLKSGSVPMTVRRMHEDGRVEVVWYEHPSFGLGAPFAAERHGMQQRIFHPAMLVPGEP